MRDRPCFEHVEVSLYFKKRCYKEDNGSQDETGLKQLMNGDGYTAIHAYLINHNNLMLPTGNALFAIIHWQRTEQCDTSIKLPNFNQFVIKLIE